MTPLPIAACHRRLDRRLRIGGWVSPLCARCTAFYLAVPLGLLAGLPFGLLLHLGLDGLTVLYLAAVAPLAADGLHQALRGRESTPARRVATGALAGLAFGLVVEALLLG